MTAGTLLERLRPGCAPNGTGWWFVGAAADWRAGRHAGLAFDAGAQALQLAPRADAALLQDWMPLEPVAAPDGTLYRVDPRRHLLLVRRPCDEAFTAVPGIGGRGHATGKLHSPGGVAVTRTGLVLVVDTGNARVQVIDASPREGAVVAAVLSAGLRAPVHAAVAPCGTVYVADRATGCVHAFSADHAPLRVLPLRSRDPWTGEAWSHSPPALPLAVAVMPQGTLAVFDPGRPFLWHMGVDGKGLPALPWPADHALPPGWRPLPARYAAGGEVVLGPFDGGIHNFAWHEVLVDTAVPPGTRVRVQTCADNESAPPALAWAPREPVAVTSAPAARTARQAAARLVLGNDEAWQRWQAGRLSRAQPVLHRFEGTGPSGGRRLTVPAAVARFLRAGDLVALTTDAGGREVARITGAPAAPVSASVSGAAPAFERIGAIRLIERQGAPLPYGPLDLRFVVDPRAAAARVPVLRDRRPTPLTLPRGLAGFLQPGDVIELDSGAGKARLELAQADAGDVSFDLDREWSGDFRTARLALVESAGRLLVAGALPAAGPLPPGTVAAVLDDGHSENQPVTQVDNDVPVAGVATVWLGEGALAGQVSAASWTNLQFPQVRATDRGRYLWVRLGLEGALPSTHDDVGPGMLATATPAVHSLRVTGPRPSLLPWLPALYGRRDPQQDSPNAGFLERFLTLFEDRLTGIEAAYESIGRLLNPQAADAEWLEFVAGWIGLSFDPSWPPERRRQLVLEGAALQAARGTPAALARYLEIYTGAPVGVAEDFQRRPAAPIQLGVRGALGVAPLGGSRERAQAHAARLAHRFSVTVTLPPEVEPAAATSAVRRIIEIMKPAHTSFRLQAAGGEAPRIGIDTVVGAAVIPAAAADCAAAPGAGAVEGRLRLGGRLGHAPLNPIASQGARHA